jgi:hypothetical protein
LLAETAIKIGKSRNKQDWEQDTERAQAKQNTKTNKMNNTDPLPVFSGVCVVPPPCIWWGLCCSPSLYLVGSVLHRLHQIQGGWTQLSAKFERRWTKYIILQTQNRFIMCLYPIRFHDNVYCCMVLLLATWVCVVPPSCIWWGLCCSSY